MSKKTKKTQTAESPEVTNQTAEENNQMEVSQSDVEPVPSTIVEASEAEVFAGQSEGQEDMGTAQAENHVVEGQVAGTKGDAQPEKPAPKLRVNKRPYIDLVTEHLEAGDMDRKELANLVLKKFPTVKKGSIETFLTDALNPRYSYYKDRVVIKHAGGKMVFADRVETQPEGQPAEPAPEEAVTGTLTKEAQPEQAAE